MQRISKTSNTAISVKTGKKTPDQKKLQFGVSPSLLWYNAGEGRKQHDLRQHSETDGIPTKVCFGCGETQSQIAEPNCVQLCGVGFGRGCVRAAVHEPFNSTQHTNYKSSKVTKDILCDIVYKSRFFVGRVPHRIYTARQRWSTNLKAAVSAISILLAASSGAFSSPTAEQTDAVTLRVACTIFAEARGESLAGKRAVASVIHNRAGDAMIRFRYAWNTALSRTCRRPAFSCWPRKGWPHAPNMRIPAERQAWLESYELARQLVAGVFEPDLESRHYAEKGLRNYWTVKAVMVCDVGNHRFYQ